MEEHPISLCEARRRLGATGWLATVPPDFRDAFLMAGSIRSFSAGGRISMAGEDANMGPGMYGVAAGQVAVLSALGASDVPTSLLFNPGSWGGYAPLFKPIRLATMSAIIPTTILCIGLGEVRKLLTLRPDGWQHIAQLGFEAGLVYATVAVDLLLLRPERRLAAMILHQADCRHGGEGWPIHLTQEQLGETARLSRHTTRLILRDFELREWISQSYRTLNVLKADELRRLVEIGGAGH